MKLRFLLLSMITFLLLGPLSASGMECEVPPFINRAVTPNVLIILDNSGSTMTEDIPGYLNRWQAAKTVIMNLLQDPVSEGFHWGLMRMDGAASDGARSRWDWNDPVTGRRFDVDSDFVRHGGKLLRPVGTDRAEIVDYINGMEVYETVPTPIPSTGRRSLPQSSTSRGETAPRGWGRIRAMPTPTTSTAREPRITGHGIGTITETLSTSPAPSPIGARRTSSSS